MQKLAPLHGLSTFISFVEMFSSYIKKKLIKHLEHLSVINTCSAIQHLYVYMVLSVYSHILHVIVRKAMLMVKVLYYAYQRFHGLAYVPSYILINIPNSNALASLML